MQEQDHGLADRQTDQRHKAPSLIASEINLFEPDPAYGRKPQSQRKNANLVQYLEFPHGRAQSNAELKPDYTTL